MADRRRQEAKGSVPKFPSFRSEARASHNSDDGISKDIEGVVHSAATDAKQRPRDSRTIPKKHHYHESRQEHRSSRSRHHSGRPPRAEDRSCSLSTPNVNPVVSKETPRLYIIDRAGDPKNLTYTTLDRHAVPAYFRSGAGSVLGSICGKKIDRPISGDKAIILSQNHHGFRPKREKNPFEKLNKIGMRELQIMPRKENNFRHDTADDFLPLQFASPKNKRKGGDADMSDSSTSSDLPLGRHLSFDRSAIVIDRVDKEDLVSDASIMGSVDDGHQTDLYGKTTLQKRTELVRRTETDPGNGNAWLDLVGYQDEIMGAGQGFRDSKITNAKRQGITEVKISIYERAIEKVANTKDRERLLLGLMEEGSRIWGITQLTSEWRALLREYPENLGLWIKYLDYKQTTFSCFRYEEARNVYVDCLDMLRRARYDTEAARTKSDNLYENQVYVLLRMTLFMREAGFTENAIGAWQAVLEWQMCKPTQFQTKEHSLIGFKTTEALSAFEDFWDSDIPRVGEENAKGWAQSVAKAVILPQPRRDSENISENGGRSFHDWMRSERSRAWQSRSVGRAADQVEEGDPYRVILFSDIRNCLVDPPVSPTSWSVIFEAFLAFCHLPPLPSECITHCTRSWWRDAFVRNESLHRTQRYASVSPMHSSSNTEVRLGSNSIENDMSLSTSRQRGPFDFPLLDYRVSSDTLFASSGNWFSAFDAWQHEYAEDRGPVKIEWIRRIIRAFSQHVLSEDHLRVYYIAFESRVAPHQVKKVVKSLIKTRPDSLLLYNAYAMIDYRSGNISSAESVSVTAINMGRALPDIDRQNTGILWRTWIWELYTSGRICQARQRLLMYPEHYIHFDIDKGGIDNPEDSTAISPSVMLRTQAALASSRDHLLSLSLPHHAIYYADLLVLLAYLTTSSLSSAHSIFHQNLCLFPSESPTHELLHQSFSSLLYHHVKRTPSFSPSFIRSTLAESITAYPRNTMFLSLYVWVESRFRIDDRVRSIMKEVVLSSRSDQGRKKESPSVISHFFAVYTELQRALALGSNTNTIRATFERAVSVDSTGAHSAGMWKLYFCFERERGGIKKARDVFWRGVRACPWAKALYLLPFDGEGDLGIGEAGFREVMQLMEEKELRIHTRFENAGGK